MNRRAYMKEDLIPGRLYRPLIFSPEYYNSFTEMTNDFFRNGSRDALCITTDKKYHVFSFNEKIPFLFIGLEYFRLDSFELKVLWKNICFNIPFTKKEWFISLPSYCKVSFEEL